MHHGEAPANISCATSGCCWSHRYGCTLTPLPPSLTPQSLGRSWIRNYHSTRWVHRWRFSTCHDVSTKAANILGISQGKRRHQSSRHTQTYSGYTTGRKRVSPLLYNGRPCLDLVTYTTALPRRRMGASSTRLGAPGQPVNCQYLLQWQTPIQYPSHQQVHHGPHERRRDGGQHGQSLPGCGWVWYEPDGIVNTITLTNMKKRHQVTYDSESDGGG